MDNLDYKALGFLLDLVQWAFMIALAIWAFIDRGRKDNRIALEDLTREVSRVDDRVIRLETVQKNMPTHKDYAGLGQTVAGLESQMKAQNNLLKTLPY